MTHRIVALLIAVIAMWAVADRGSAQNAGLQEVFDDWQVGCQEAQGRTICTLAQDVRAQGGSDRLLSIRVDIADPAQPPRVTIATPLGIDVAEPLLLFLGRETEHFQTAQPRVCQPSGCFAFLTLDQSLRDALEGQTALRVRMIPFRGAPPDIPVSLRGFETALERLFELSEG